MKKKTNIQKDLNSRENIEQNQISQTVSIIAQEQEPVKEVTDAESQNLQGAAPDTICQEPKKGKRKT